MYFFVWTTFRLYNGGWTFEDEQDRFQCKPFPQSHIYVNHLFSECFFVYFYVYWK